jgi:hypothetical protein
VNDPVADRTGMSMPSSGQFSGSHDPTPFPGLLPFRHCSELFLNVRRYGMAAERLEEVGHFRG